MIIIMNAIPGLKSAHSPSHSILVLENGIYDTNIKEYEILSSWGTATSHSGNNNQPTNEKKETEM
ncbi:hypothetical protein L873DRAFT_1811119, partial [Choiromyces venosus 120613-1]